MFHVNKIYKITYLEIKFDFLKNALHCIQNSFFYYDIRKNGFLMISLSNRTLIGLLPEQKSLKKRLTHNAVFSCRCTNNAN